MSDACASDEALNREVESLLAQDSRAFLETPAIDVAKLIGSEHASLGLVNNAGRSYAASVALTNRHLLAKHLV